MAFESGLGGASSARYGVARRTFKMSTAPRRRASAFSTCSHSSARCVSYSTSSLRAVVLVHRDKSTPAQPEDQRTNASSRNRVDDARCKRMAVSRAEGERWIHEGHDGGRWLKL